MVNELPQCNRLLLRHVIRVLYAVHRNSEVTKMTSHNLAVCVGPSLLWSRKATLESQKTDVTRVVAVIQGLIDDAESIFGPDILDNSSHDQLDNRSEDDSESENHVDSEIRDHRHVVSRDNRHMVSSDNEVLEDSGSYDEEDHDGGEWRRHLSRSFNPTEGSADEDNSDASHPFVKKSPKTSSAGESNDCEASAHGNEAVKHQFTRRLAIRRYLVELAGENKHSSNDDDHQHHLDVSDGASFDPPPSPLPSGILDNKPHSPAADMKASEQHQSERTKQKSFADSFNSTEGPDSDLPTCEEPAYTVVSSNVKSNESACLNDSSVNRAAGCRQRRGMTGKGSDLFPGVLMSDTFRLKSVHSWSMDDLDHEMNGDAGGKCVSDRNVRPCGSLDELAVESDFEKKFCYGSDFYQRKFECCDGRQWDSDIGESSSKREVRVGDTASGRSHVNTSAIKFSPKETSTPNSDQSAAERARSKKEIKTEQDTNAIESRGSDGRGKGEVTSTPAETKYVTSRSHESSSSSSSSDDDQKPVSDRYEYNRANRMEQSREDIQDSQIRTDQSIRLRSKSDSNAVFITRLFIHNDLHVSLVENLSDRHKAVVINTASSSSDSSSENQLNERINGRGENLNQIEANCANVAQTMDNYHYQHVTEMLSAIPARSRRPVAINVPAWDNTENVSSTDGPATAWSGGRHGKSAEGVFRDRPAEEPVTRTPTNISIDVGLSTLVEPDLIKHESNAVNEEAFQNGAPRANLVVKRMSEFQAKSANVREISHSTQNRKDLAPRLGDCNSSSPVVGASAKKSAELLNEKERISGGKNLAKKDGKNFPAAKRVNSFKVNNVRESSSHANPRTRHPNAKTSDASRDVQLPLRTFEIAKRSQYTGNPIAQDIRCANSQPRKTILPEPTANSAYPGDRTESSRSQSRRAISRSASLSQPKTPSIRLSMRMNNPVIPEVSRRTRSGLGTHNRDPGQKKTRDLAKTGKVSPEGNQSQTLAGIGDISGTTTRHHEKPLGRPSKTKADGPRLRPIRPSPFASARSIESPQETLLSIFPQTLEGSSSSKRQEFSNKSDAKRQNPSVQTAAKSSRGIIPHRTQKIPVKH